MSDATLRALHRSWKAEGTAEAGAAYLKACVQHGALDEGRVAVAALGGLRAARLVLPRRCFDPSETFHEVIAPGLWRRRVPTAADGSADLYALVDALFEGRIPGEPLHELGLLVEAALPGAGLQLARMAIGAGAELQGAVASMRILDETDDLRALVSRRAELEDALGVDTGLDELELALDPPPGAPSSAEFVGMALFGPIRALLGRRSSPGSPRTEPVS